MCCLLTQCGQCISSRFAVKHVVLYAAPIKHTRLSIYLYLYFFHLCVFICLLIGGLLVKLHLNDGMDSHKTWIEHESQSRIDLINFRCGFR